MPASSAARAARPMDPMLPPPSALETLIAAIARGDRSALERLYEETSPLVFDVARRLLGEGHEAEEVVLDVFTRVWSRASEFDRGRGSVQAWLLTMARSRAIDARRALQARREREASALYDDVDAGRGSEDAEPLDALLENERGVLLLRALADLGPDERAAIEHAFFDGLSHENVARVLAAPLGTVKGQIRRGLQRMRAALERNGMAR